MTDTITSERLYQAILHGAASIRARREDLNRINVFPVIDYDTGNNLAHTMNYILTHASVHPSVRETLREIARSALMSARGNSGVIFSQYFNGMYLESAEKDAVTLAELAVYFQEAYNKAYKSLENAVEGTVITVMRAWAVSFREALSQHKSPLELFESALAHIRQALEETRYNLRALKTLGLVDAGALGFYYFMEGFVQALSGKVSLSLEQSQDVVLPDVEDDIHRFSEHETIPFRYCTEVLADCPNLNQDALRETLKDRGDCLLIASADTLVRVHLHTNEPWNVVKAVAGQGKVLEQKADDMVQQNLLAGVFEERIAIVTDSIADLPQDYIFNHRIFQVPINIVIDEVSFLDKVTIDHDYLYTHLSRASSAQPNTEQVLALLQPLLKRFSQVLVLTVSSKMSGTWSRFREAIDTLGDDAGRVALIDTKVNSGAEGLLVKKAVELAEAGQPLDIIVTQLEALKARAKILVSVLDIEPMARSGRVSERIGNLLIKLQFKPLVTIKPSGEGSIKGVAFSVKMNNRIFRKSLKRQKMESYVIVHADGGERVETLRQDMVRFTGMEPLYITDISSVVTLFAGKGAVAVAYLEKAQTEEANPS
ncbi:MAG: DegV family EDD domain-containing protein [Clostridiaceae bacterium]|nr:DegV family EDD domain-containing protein [Clostridiaceae bacterium]